MVATDFRYKLLLFLFELCFGFTFNIVGTISLSELFLVLTFFVYLTPKENRIPEIQKITLIYFILIFWQIISEMWVGNTLNNALRGIAVTVFSYLHFRFLFHFFLKDKKLILFALLGMLIYSIAFTNSIVTDIDTDSDKYEAVYLKFYLIPIITNALLVLSLIYSKRWIFIFFIATGIICIILGARSGGGIILLIGLSIWFLTKERNFSRTRVIVGSIALLIIGYGLYCLYVKNILNGRITEGNSEQVAKLENPYNPMSLLLMGRSEVYVGMTAYLDEPTFGYGSWAPDPNGMYHYMLLLLHEDDEKKIYNLTWDYIPNHSVLFGYAANNGTIALICILLLSTLFIKKGLSIIQKVPNRFRFVLLYSIISILWNTLFSPISFFRLDMCFNYAVILALYLSYHDKKNNETNYLNYDKNKS